MGLLHGADDHAVVRAGIRLILDQADGIEVVGEAGTEERAVVLARAHQPDVMRSFTLTRKMLFDGDAGVLEHGLKELTRAYIAHTIECGY